MQIHRDAEVLGSHTGLHARPRVRRRRLRQAAASPRAGRRRSDRHAGPHHRFRQTARDRPALGAGAGARRGRSHVRSRLHRRHPLHPAAPAGTRAAPQHAVLRHAVAARAGARLRAHERSDAGAHRAGQDDGGSRASGDLLPVERREAAPAGRAAQAHGSAPQHGVRQHAARGRRHRSSCCAATASTPKRSPATCPSASACACCAIFTKARSRC